MPDNHDPGYRCLLCLRPIHGAYVDLEASWREPSLPERQEGEWLGGFVAVVHEDCADWLDQRWHASVGCDHHDGVHLPWPDGKMPVAGGGAGFTASPGPATGGEAGAQ